MLTSVLITNIGNGMHTIAVGKLLYDQTGSAAAFGFVIVVEYIINFLMQLSAGSLVDRGKPKQVCVYTDIVRGLFICLASFMVFSTYGYLWILAVVLVLHTGTPFYRAATFAIGPAVAPGDLLTRYNGLNSTFVQIGQLLGAASVGFIIQFFGTDVAFAMNGVSFILAGLAVWVATIPPIEAKTSSSDHSWVTNFIDDWSEIWRLLRSNLALSWHIVLCGGDVLAVSLINLSLVPLVSERFGNNSYWLSAFDSSFAIGAMAAAIFAPKVIARLDLRNMAGLGIGAQGLLYAILSFLYNPYIVMLVMVAIGAMNACSLIILWTHLQRRSQGPIKGRISGVLQLTLSFLAAILIPLVARAHEVSLTYGLLAAGAICATFSVLIFILSRRRFFGAALLGLDEQV
jgi:MFS family permease